METNLLSSVAMITAAYVSNNTVDELPTLIKSIHATLSNLGDTATPTRTPTQVSVKSEPAVPPTKSVFREYIICLEDGKKLKMLRRHLNNAFGMTPQQYRTKWGLPASYPMVAPAYAKQRSDLAKASGLGTTKNPPAKRAVRRKAAAGA